MKTYFHGEVVIKLVSSLPKSAKEIKPKNGHWIIADSETTGNHHIVEESEGLGMYEVDGVLYLKAEEEAHVSCVVKERHDTEVIPPGIWKIERAKEYDFLKDEIRRVQD